MKNIMDGVWVVDFGKPGKTVAIVGGMHGNELAGVEVVEFLRKQFSRGELRLSAGKLILAIGSPPAVQAGARYVYGEDLNRLFTDLSLGEHAVTWPVQRAQDLARALGQADILVDLHATNRPSQPFVVCQRRTTAAENALIALCHVGALIHDPDYLFGGGEPVSLDEYVTRQGGLGICYETGYAPDLSRPREIAAQMLALLGATGLICGGFSNGSGSVPARFKLCQAIRLDTTAGFAWALGAGQENLEPVQSGQALLINCHRQVRASEDGILVFPKDPSLWRPREPVGYVAKKWGG